jgi:hypothetical protein
MSALVLTTLVVGAIGYSHEAAHLTTTNVALREGLESGPRAGRFLDLLYLTLGLFFLNGKSTYGNPALMIARWSGALFAFASLVKLLTPHLAGWVQRLRIRTLSGHTIVVGLGEKGLSFVRDASQREAVVAVDIGVRGADDLGEGVVRRRVYLLRGDGTKPETLRQAGLDRAARLVVSTKADATNLAVAHQAAAIAQPRPTGLVGGLDILVHTGTPVLRLDGLSGTKVPAGVNVRPFSVPALAARRLAAAWPFELLARWLGANVVNLVFVGFDELAEEILRQAVLRVSSLAGRARPRITIFSAEAERVRTRLDRNLPALRELVAELSVRPYDPTIDLSPGEMATVEGAGRQHPVTAIVISQPTDTDAVVLARRVRAHSRKHDLWLAPVFVRLDRPAEFASATAPIRRVKWLSRAIEPFGDLAELCSARGLRAWDEQRAQALHAAWRAGAPAGDPSPARNDWNAIEEEYRDANRRAIDHFSVKLGALGYVLRGDPPNFRKPMELNASSRTMLAELEHESWTAEKLLAGWRRGPVRDSVRRIHENLVPFSRLGPVQQKDLSQIDQLLRACANPKLPVTCFRERRIGLVGAHDLGRLPADELSARAAEMLTELGYPRHLGPESDEFWTFVTELAEPNLTFAKALAERLRGAPPGRYRFVVIKSELETVRTPEEFVARDAVELGIELPPHGALTPEEYLRRCCDDVIQISASPQAGDPERPVVIPARL